MRRLFVEGSLRGQRIKTTVDSELARYFIERREQGRSKDVEFERIIEDSLLELRSHSLDRQRLATIAQRTSPDLATLCLVEQLMADGANAELQSIFEDELVKADSELGAGHYRLHLHAVRTQVLFVPGWVYQSKPETGADFAGPRKLLTELGLENRLVEIAEAGTIEGNAVQIGEAIEVESRGEKDIILVSASSGGPSTALALANIQPSLGSTRVKAWVNVGGLLRGSFVADHALRWPRSWLSRLILFLNGWSVESVRSMGTKRSQERFMTVQLPGDLQVVNYLGAPLSGDITKQARGGFRCQRHLGPNDGMTLLADALIEKARTVVCLGLDHYHDSEQRDNRTIALTQAVLRMIAGDLTAPDASGGTGDRQAR